MTTCSYDDCDKPAHTRGWCTGHYGQMHRRGYLSSLGDRTKRVDARGTCGAPGCARGHYAKGLCNAHWNQARSRPDARLTDVGSGRTHYPDYAPRACAWCGAEYQPSGGKQRFCTKACLNKRCLATKYGITLDQLRALGEACALCGTGFDLHVDHHHETGRVRGMLCRKHNQGLGFFKDDPALLRAAADYLERSTIEA